MVVGFIDLVNQGFKTRAKLTQRPSDLARRFVSQVTNIVNDEDCVAHLINGQFLGSLHFMVMVFPFGSLVDDIGLLRRDGERVQPGLTVRLHRKRHTLFLFIQAGIRTIEKFVHGVEDFAESVHRIDVHVITPKRGCR